MDARAREIISEWERGDGDRATFKSHWQECANYVQPDRSDYLVDKTPGQKRMQYVFDSTPIWANQQFSAGLHSLLTSPTLQWFGLRADDDRLNNDDEVRNWLDDASAVMYAIFNSPRRNFASQSQELYLDLGCIGTGCMAVLDSFKSQLLFSTRHMKECVIAENDEDRVDYNNRRWQFTAKQAWNKWGAKAGEKVAKAYAEGKEDKKFAFFHRVKPRKDRDPQRADARHKAFESVYVGQEDAVVISEGGFDEFPYLTPRFSKVTGEMYGRGPAMTALPDIKMLNELTKIVVKSAQKIVDPPLMLPDDGFVVPVKTVPGAFNFYRSGLKETDRIAPIETGGQVQIGNEMLDALRNTIARTFFVDLLRMPTDMQDPAGDGKGSTATYWMQRREKEMMALSPMLARLNCEYSDPLIERVFAVLWRLSLSLRFGPGSPFPPPPQQLSGAKLRVEYVSPIAMAQKSSQLDAIDRVLARMLQLKQIDPSTPMIVDAEDVMRLTAKDTNAPVSMLKSSDQLQQEAQQEAEQQAMLQNHAAIANLAKSAKDGTGALKNVADASAAQGQREAA